MFVQQPIVIEDAMKGSYNRADWTRGGLVRICGNQKMAYVPQEACAEAGDACHSVREINSKLVGRTWAGLQVTNLTAAGITTLADFMRAQVRRADSRSMLQACFIGSSFGLFLSA